MFFIFTDLQGVKENVGIYKRKQESKKTRKHAFDQDSDQGKLEKLSFFFSYFLVFFYKFSPLYSQQQPSGKGGKILNIRGKKTFFQSTLYNINIRIHIKVARGNIIADIKTACSCLG